MDALAVLVLLVGACLMGYSLEVLRLLWRNIRGLNPASVTIAERVTVLTVYGFGAWFGAFLAVRALRALRVLL